MLARDALLLCEFDINSVNPTDLLLGPSIQMQAALPSIVGTSTSPFQIRVELSKETQFHIVALNVREIQKTNNKKNKLGSI